MTYRKYHASVAVICMSLVALCSCNTGHISSAGIAWEAIEPGLFYHAGQLPVSGSNTVPVTVYMIRTDLERHQALIRTAIGRPRMALSELVPKGDIVVLNGGYFEADGQPSGLVRSQGTTVAKLWGGGSGALLLFEGRAKIIFKRNYPEGEEPSDAIQAGPVMVEPGGKPGIRSRSDKLEKRSFAAVPIEGGLILGATASGVDLYDLAEYLRLQVGVDSALNLDGGPSTGFYIRHPRKSVSIEPVWPVPNAISLTRREGLANYP